ncbi:MAG: M48 family metallopeptidase, partial [Candidatus Thorarchaeota archaeon]
WIIGFDVSQNNPIISLSLFLGIGIFQMIMLYYVSLGMLNGTMMRELHPKFDDTKPWHCKYSRDELVQWSHEIAEISKVKLSRVYVMQSPIPNAFTFSLPFVGSVLVIFSNLTDLLDVDEVKSIIAHEIGHIRNHDSLVSIFSQMPNFFVDIIYLYIYVRIGLGVATALLVNFDVPVAGIRVIVLLAFFFISRLVMTVAKLFIQKSSRAAELLADHHAAETIGTVPTMNALIRLGQRVEAITALTATIRWLESLNPERVNPITQAELGRMLLAFPLDGIDEKNAESMAPWVYLYTKLKHLREVYGVELSDQQIIDAITPAANTLSEKRAEKVTEEKGEQPIKVVDWRVADADGDSRLSTDELMELITMLRNNPKKLMFDSEVGNNLLLLDHPDFRRRVLFLADTCDL